jgi:hypothetical protein
MGGRGGLRGEKGNFFFVSVISPSAFFLGHNCCINRGVPVIILISQLICIGGLFCRERF